MFRADRSGDPSFWSRSEANKQESTMRTETENLVDEIKQAISLLRRHL
jgi:hypothetical protein